MSRLGGGIGTARARRDEARGRPAAHPPTDRQAPARYRRPGTDPAAEAGRPGTVRRSPGGPGRLHQRREVDPDERFDRRGGARCRPALRHAGSDHPSAVRCRTAAPPCCPTRSGFVRKLPHDLVEAFKSTLEEVTRGDMMLLHVADASAHEPRGADRRRSGGARRDRGGRDPGGPGPEQVGPGPTISSGPGSRRVFPDGVPVSALDRRGVGGLLATRMRDALPVASVEVTLLVPFDRPEVVPWLHREADVLRVSRGRGGRRSGRGSRSASWPMWSGSLWRRRGRRPASRTRRGRRGR